MKIEDIIKLIEVIQKFNLYHVLYIGAIVVILYFGYAGWVDINLQKERSKIEIEYEAKTKEIEYLKLFQQQKDP